MNNIMIDIETLASHGKAVVVSIGATSFDAAGINGRFYVELTNDVDAQKRKGRVESSATMEWWKKQSPEAQAVLFPADEQHTFEFRRTTAQGLTELSDFIENHGGRDCPIWANGPDFDCVIMASLYNDFGIKVPWSYGKHRCYRTISRLFWNRASVNHDISNDEPHNALADAVTQTYKLLHMHKTAGVPLE